MNLNIFVKLKSTILNLSKDKNNILHFFFNAIKPLSNSFFSFFKQWEKNYSKIFLFLLIIFGLFIRLPYIKSGLPYLNHSDEIHVAGTAISILQTGDFNPHFFRYPSLTTYIVLPAYIINYFRLSANGLTSLNNISIGWETVTDGSISHPSFYAVGRFMMVFLGILCIYLVYEVGKRYFNKKIGLFSALILAFFPFHTYWSRIINPNVTVSFFVLLTLLFIALYIKTKKIAFMLAMGLSAGLAAASKYNALLIICPVIFMIIFYSHKKIRDFSFTFIATSFGFFIGCPYSIFDLSAFLDDAGFEFYHYKFRGHPGAEGIPGKEQIHFYLNHFKDWINNIFHFRGIWNLSVIGTLLKFISDYKNTIIVFSFPVFYIIFMSQQKVNFTRNMLCITPFICLSSAFILFYVYKGTIFGLNYLRNKMNSRIQVNNEIVFIVYFVLLIMIINPFGTIKEAAFYKKNYKETRTKAIEYVKDNFPGAKIGVSKELKIHPFDLEKLKNIVVFDTQEKSLSGLYEEGFDYIISSNKFFFYNENNRREHPDLLDNLERKFPDENLIESFGDGSVVIDFLSKEPRINIYRVDKTFLK